MEYNVNKFKKMLLQENKEHNLVSRKSTVKELDKHIEDSLRALDFVQLKEEKVVDIGSGAGFPGLILAMHCPRARFSLVEADRKKSLFLEKVWLEIGLTNVEVINRRAEELGQDSEYRGRFDICTSRAVASMNVILEYGLPLVQVGGKLILWKGRNYHQEIEQSGRALSMLGGRVVGIHLYTLKEKNDRAILVVQKEQPTPAKFPRRVGVPAKRPL